MLGKQPRGYSTRFASNDALSTRNHLSRVIAESQYVANGYLESECAADSRESTLFFQSLIVYSISAS